MSPSPSSYDVIIIGAGAAGLMCAIEAGKRGRKVWLIDHSKKTAEKIRISGGGRCNFTNIHTSPTNFLSQNKHFCKSALSGYTPQDFINLLTKHNISYFEKTLGQLFCEDSAQNIIDMLLTECREAGVTISMETTVHSVSHVDVCNKNITNCVQATQTSGKARVAVARCHMHDETDHYSIDTTKGTYACASLVIATGGLSIPKIGATPFGYHIAEQFGLNIIKPRAGLVPLTFDTDIKEKCKALTGLSVNARVSTGTTRFTEGMLFTHRGLSGPSILQISSYWTEGTPIHLNMVVDHDMWAFLKERKHTTPKQDILKIIAELLPKRLADTLCTEHRLTGRIADLSDKKLIRLATTINNWTLHPCGTEGYRTAEVTLGGIDTATLSSKTFEAKTQKNLYFIGEVIDVTGHLGGFNFQWAWASGFATGQVV